MIEAASETALATADPAALCPLVAPARSLSNAEVWTLADGMCAALEGESARAGAIVDQVRDRNGTSIDLQLAEKVIGAGAETRRAIQVDWDGVSRITPWRFGLASATGIAIPAPLIEGAGPRFQAWLARAPMVPLEQRLAAASTAASLGILSSNALVEIYSMALDQTDPAEAADTVGARLRTAWIEQDPGRRMTALRSLWTESESVVERRARLILTAGAAARIPVSDTLADDAANLIASMLSAGLDAQAARWAPVIEQSGASGRAWAMLALGAPRPSVSLDAGRIQAFVDADDSPGRRRGPMLVAGLAGLGRINATRRVRRSPAEGRTTGPGRSTRPRANGRRAPSPSRGGRPCRPPTGGLAARSTLPYRPGAARGRPRVRGADDRRGGRAAVTPRRGARFPRAGEDRQRIAAFLEMMPRKPAAPATPCSPTSAICAAPRSCWAAASPRPGPRRCAVSPKPGCR